jgi:hypothetical protein
MKTHKNITCPKCGHIFDPYMDMLEKMVEKQYGKEYLNKLNEELERS